MIYVHTFQTRIFSNQGAEKLSARIVGFLSHVFFFVFFFFGFINGCTLPVPWAHRCDSVYGNAARALPEVLFGDGCREARAALCDGGLGSLFHVTTCRGAGGALEAAKDVLRVWMKRGFFWSGMRCAYKFRRTLFKKAKTWCWYVGYLVTKKVIEWLTGGSSANKKLRQQDFWVYESGVIIKITFDIWLEVSPPSKQWPAVFNSFFGVGIPT